MRDGSPIIVLMTLRIPSDLKKRFIIESLKRDTTASFLVRDYILKQLAHWEHGSSARPSAS
jgi:hypothetical protein